MTKQKAPAPITLKVLAPLPLGSAFDYLAPCGQTFHAGDFVIIPLGRRTVEGVVWGMGESGVEACKLKEIIAPLEAPPLPVQSRRFVDWVAAYTLQPPGLVLKMAMSCPEALITPKSAVAYALNPNASAIRLTEARRRVLLAMEQETPLPAAKLAATAKVSNAVIRELAKAKVLMAVDLPFAAPPVPIPDHQRPGPVLSPDQAAAAAALRDKTAAGGFSVTVLDGVPGSGKTEVYFEAIASVLGKGQQALVLLPEIALGAQWLNRFASRFGAKPALWHSELTKAQRRDTWRAAANGRAKVLVGARSALFLPFPNLGIIVVDEEHDGSYKQEEGVIYNARDMAVARAQIGQIPIILVSATPSLETVINAKNGRYQTLHLPNRHGGAIMPVLQAIDMRGQPLKAGHWLSKELCAALTETFQEGGQAMLFLNRRGYAPLTLCRACGRRLQCPRCTAWLVEHRRIQNLQCHHCGFTARLPERCPSCDAEASFAACGPGVERLAEEAAAIFPNARTAIAASDTLQGPAAAALLVQRMENHEVDLLIGTQIVAKGYHFPMLTLVGVIDADLGLSGGDLRASEKTYQLLYQVAGRAGRESRPGRVLLQTFMPDHPVMKALAAGDSQQFLAAEANMREQAQMPPFGRLASLIVSGGDESAVKHSAMALARAAPRADGATALGPAPAPLYLLRGKFRQRLLLKTGKNVNIQALLRQWLANVRIPSKVRVQVDVDPYSFL